MKKSLTALAVCAAITVSYWAYGASSSQQEYQDALHSTPNPDRGAELFRTCLVCHGPTGQGSVDGGAPRIGGQHFSVLIGQLVDYRHDKRWDPRMEHFADQHQLVGPQAVADVAAYVSQLESVPQDAIGVGSGELVTRGADVYKQACASCHGPAGEGSGRRAIPQVAGQHYEYLRRQIYDAVDGRRPNFSASHIRLLARLEHDDIAGVSDFLSRTPRHVDLRSLEELARAPAGE